MSFLQPWLLFALPLIALPVIIHLINRRRYRTVPWGAMMFLLDAQRMTQGMAKLRQFMILALRVLAVSALVFAVSRPLASNWIGGVGGTTDTTLVLLDRSASMEQQNLQTGQSKRATALNKVAEMLQKTGSSNRLVLIESATLNPMELDSPEELKSSPESASTSTAADVPTMLEKALDYLEANKSGRSDIWLCTDQRENDWDAGSGRWESVRARAGQLKGLRLFLLSYPNTAEDNVTVRVTQVAKRVSAGQSTLVIDAVLQREANTIEPVSIPLEFIVNGVRSTLQVDMDDVEFILQGHTIPIDSKLERGYGRLELPADSNPLDNTFNFAFAEPSTQKTIIVSDNFTFAETVRLACEAPLDPQLEYDTELFEPSEANQIDWETAALIVWQGALPEGIIAQQLMNFVDAGKTILFFPPGSPQGKELFDHAWTQWDDKQSEADPIETWRTDTGILANTQDGNALPVGELRIFRHCGLQAIGSVFARLESGATLLSRATTTRGAAWFCATLPQATHSSMAREGVVFYVMLHRAIAEGSLALGEAKMVDSSEGVLTGGDWKPIGEQERIVTSARDLNAGIFEDSNSGRLIALNRPAAEDVASVLDESQLDVLLEGIDFRRIVDEAGSMTSLASEIWRLFLFVLGIALVTEAILCLPDKQRTQGVPENA